MVLPVILSRMFHLMIVRNVEFDLHNLENAMTYKGIFPASKLGLPTVNGPDEKKQKQKQNYAVSS